MAVKPFSSHGKIMAVTLNHSKKELLASVCRHPETGLACLEASNGDVKLVDWHEITFIRDLGEWETGSKREITLKLDYDKADLLVDALELYYWHVYKQNKEMDKDKEKHGYTCFTAESIQEHKKIRQLQRMVNKALM